MSGCHWLATNIAACLAVTGWLLTLLHVRLSLVGCVQCGSDFGCCSMSLCWMGGLLSWMQPLRRKPQGTYACLVGLSASPSSEVASLAVVYVLCVHLSQCMCVCRVDEDLMKTLRPRRDILKQLVENKVKVHCTCVWCVCTCVCLCVCVYLCVVCALVCSQLLTLRARTVQLQDLS